MLSILGKTKTISSILSAFNTAIADLKVIEADALNAGSDYQERAKAAQAQAAEQDKIVAEAASIRAKLEALIAPEDSVKLEASGVLVSPATSAI